MRSSPEQCFFTDTDSTANLRTNNLDFPGFDSSISWLRGGILVSVGNFREALSRQILVGMILAGRLGVKRYMRRSCWRPGACFAFCCGSGRRRRP